MLDFLCPNQNIIRLNIILYYREHSSTIKKRFFSVFIMALISPVFLYFGMSNKVLEKVANRCSIDFSIFHSKINKYE